MGKKIQINLSLKDVLYCAVIGVMAYFLFFRGNTEMNEYKAQYQQERAAELKRIAADSIVLDAQYKSVVSQRDSLVKEVGKNDIEKQKIIRYYEKRIHDNHTLAPAAVDHKLDSILASRHHS